MTRTSNYDLIVVEGSDKVNLLTQMNPNTEKIDEVMKANENSGIHIATELLSGTVHAITRTVKSASMFKFTAVSNYTAGDTFTVDGEQVTALLTSGEALGTGAYIIGSEVLCSLKDTLLTVYTNGGTALLADDSEKLGGNLPEYYAKQSDLTQVSNVANSASELSRSNSDSINSINQSLTFKYIGTFQGNKIHQMDFSKYTEYLFFIDCNLGNVNRIIEFNVLSAILSNEKGYFIGGAQRSDNNTCYVSLHINNKEFSCEEFFINGENYADMANIIVYAK